MNTNTGTESVPAYQKSFCCSNFRQQPLCCSHLLHQQHSHQHQCPRSPPDNPSGTDTSNSQINLLNDIKIVLNNIASNIIDIAKEIADVKECKLKDDGGIQSEIKMSKKALISNENNDNLEDFDHIQTVFAEVHESPNANDRSNASIEELVPEDSDLQSSLNCSVPTSQLL